MVAGRFRGLVRRCWHIPDDKNDERGVEHQRSAEPHHAHLRVRKVVMFRCATLRYFRSGAQTRVRLGPGHERTWTECAEDRVAVATPYDGAGEESLRKVDYFVVPTKSPWYIPSTS